jgi:formylglycine-generating enzyme required for sulfatase activity
MRWLTCGTVLWVAGWSSLAAAEGDPPHYVRGATWQEALFDSTLAILARGLEEPFPTLESETLRGGASPRRISVELRGASEIYLFVTGVPDPIWGVGTWGDARLVAADGSVVPLGQVPGLEVLKGQHAVDVTLRSGLNQRLRLEGRTFARGINVLADSAIRVPLDGKFQRFESWIGVDDWAGREGRVRFGVAGNRSAARRLLWDLLIRDFPDGQARREMRWEIEDRIQEQEAPERDGLRRGGEGRKEDLREPRGALLGALARRYAASSRRVPPLGDEAARLAASARDLGGLARVREAYYRSRSLDEARRALGAFPFESVRLALEDLVATYGGDRYPRGGAYLARLGAIEGVAAGALAALEGDSPAAGAGIAAYERVASILAEARALRDEALLANPLLDFERLLVIRRTPAGDPRRSQWADRGLGEYIGLPRQSSWGISTIPNPLDWENEIAILSPVRPGGELSTLYRPLGRRLLTDLDLRFDAESLLFSMPDDGARWQVCEIRADGSGFRQLTPGDQPEVHSYDACYLPNGTIAFISTAPLQGVPCNAGVVVGMMYRMEADGSGIEQLCFEQDHDYTPSVLNDGRVLYLRWDYTDTPHVWNRLLMAMHPDGTGQMEYYGSNSYWPNAVFFARAVPDHPTKIVGIVTGHHEGRVGELVLFDPALGRREVEGVVQRIPGRGQKVEPLIEDKLTEHSWPKMLHPWPLSEKYFLVAAKPTPDALWGIYLVDVFDNMVLLREEEGRALLEPIPFRKIRRPPLLAERARRGEAEALAYVEDIYVGPGLRGIPKGSVKGLRVFTYHFGYQRVAGIDHRVGADGPWEVKRVLGTVPVEEDGSAFFRIPAKTPISLQPLDAEGKALALMRSWMTAMPGETLSCTGCHEPASTSIPNRRTIAFGRDPSEMAPWRGPVRGFSFRRDVQPALDRHCVGCHGEAEGDRTDGGGRGVPPDLRSLPDTFVVYAGGDPERKVIRGVPREDLAGKYAGVFDPPYVALRAYVRVGGLESDLHPLPPMEFHADTSELVQMLRKGHHGVELDRDAWDRLITWIDLNAPCNGSWRETTRIPIANQPSRRLELRRLYGGVPENHEEIPDASLEGERGPIDPLVPAQRARPSFSAAECPGWPFDAAEAARRQGGLDPAQRTLDLGAGVSLDLVRIPAGSFVMGSAGGDADEAPPHRVEIGRPFWMSLTEVTNEQYARFDPAHRSRFEHRTSWIFSEEYLGWPLDRPRQPVVRVSWQQAASFCRWLTSVCGEEVDLPTEEEWEYACRAGSAAPFSWGGADVDFSPHANLGDRRLRDLAYEGWRPRAPDLVPRDDRFDDGALVTALVGSYAPNPWGLHDMHGNAAEWTRSDLRPYPAPEAEPRESPGPADSADPCDRAAEPRLLPKVVRGGSWRDRPYRATSSFRLGYPPYQRVFNVGFRVVIEETPLAASPSPPDQSPSQ